MVVVRPYPGRLGHLGYLALFIVVCSALAACSSGVNVTTLPTIIVPPVVGHEAPNALTDTPYPWISLVDSSGQRLLQWERSSGATRTTELDWNDVPDSENILQIDILVGTYTMQWVVRTVENDTIRTRLMEMPLTDVENGFLRNRLKLATDKRLAGWLYGLGAYDGRVYAAGASGLWNGKELVAVTDTVWYNAQLVSDAVVVTAADVDGPFAYYVTAAETSARMYLPSVTGALAGFVSDTTDAEVDRELVGVVAAGALYNEWRLPTTEASAVTEAVAIRPHVRWLWVPAHGAPVTIEADQAARKIVPHPGALANVPKSFDPDTKTAPGMWIERADTGWIRADDSLVTAAPHKANGDVQSTTFVDETPFSNPKFVSVAAQASATGPYLVSQNIRAEFEGDVGEYLPEVFAQGDTICSAIRHHVLTGDDWITERTSTKVVLDADGCIIAPTAKSADEAIEIRPLGRWSVSGTRAGLLATLPPNDLMLIGKVSIGFREGNDASTRGDRFALRYTSGWDAFRGDGTLQVLRIDRRSSQFVAFDGTLGRTTAWNYQTGNIMWTRR